MCKITFQTLWTVPNPQLGFTKQIHFHALYSKLFQLKCIVCFCVSSNSSKFLRTTGYGPHWSMKFSTRWLAFADSACSISIVCFSVHFKSVLQCAIRAWKPPPPELHLSRSAPGVMYTYSVRLVSGSARNELNSLLNTITHKERWMGESHWGWLEHD